MEIQFEEAKKKTTAQKLKNAQTKPPAPTKRVQWNF